MTRDVSYRCAPRPAAPTAALLGLLLLLVAPGCGKNPVAPTLGDPGAWSVVPEDTLVSPEDAFVWRPQFSPDGRFIAMTGMAGLYLSAYPPVGPVRLVIPGEIQQVAWSPDGRYLAVTPNTGPHLIIYDAVAGAVHAQVQQPGASFLSNTTWVTDNLVAASSLLDGLAFLYDANGRAVELSQLGRHGYAWQHGLGNFVSEVFALSSGAATRQRIFGPGLYVMLYDQAPATGLLLMMDYNAATATVTTAVADYTGHVRHVLEPDFNFTLTSAWSTDGRYLTGTRTRHDEHEVLVGAELVVYDTVTGTSADITRTADVIEEYPSLCTATRRLAYGDTFGHVVVARVITE